LFQKLSDLAMVNQLEAQKLVKSIFNGQYKFQVHSFLFLSFFFLLKTIMGTDETMKFIMPRLEKHQALKICLTIKKTLWHKAPLRDSQRVNDSCAPLYKTNSV